MPFITAWGIGLSGLALMVGSLIKLLKAKGNVERSENDADVDL
jgi:hypothetical protein